jgi:DNA invertase Pin-like site-specific DNA recombinase
MSPRVRLNSHRKLPLHPRASNAVRGAEPKLSTPSSQLSPAAQYLRMSTDHQQYSTLNQSAAIALYAAAHNLGIVRSFVDEGKSGTSIKRREGLQELLRVVESGGADFTNVLVYDVSRWGRFPDTDEAAHYEFVCKRAGIAVRYCAEQFENDNSVTSNLLKALKRTMAGEFSRELSVKVSTGQRRLASMGWWQGGNGPFGFQRMLVSQDGKRKHILKVGEWKSISTDRIALTPGPRNAVDTVRLAFDLYTKHGTTRKQIAEILNKRGVFLHKRPWSLTMVRELLTSHIYKGAYAYCKHDHHFITLPRDKWLIREHAFEGIVSEEQWTRANALVQKETKPLIDSEMLDALRQLWKRKGKLTSDIINAAKEIPSAQAYRNHFGGVNEAYKLIGYPLIRDLSFGHAVRMSRDLRNAICEEICERVRQIGGRAEKMMVPGMLRLNENVTAKVAIRKAWIRDGRIVWHLPLGKQPVADILVVGRVNPPEPSIFDYFLVPAFSQLRGGLRARLNESVAYLELYHFKTLDPLIEVFRLCSVQVTA